MVGDPCARLTERRMHVCCDREDLLWVPPAETRLPVLE